MFGTRARKIYRDVTARKTRTALVSTSIFVGVLGVVILTTMGHLVTSQLERDLNPDEMAMLRIYLDLPADAVVDNDIVLGSLGSRPYVTDVEGQAAYEFAWKRPAETSFQAGHLFAYTSPFGQINLEPIRLLRGAYPVAGRRELAIEERMANKHHLAIGDAIDVRVNGAGSETWRIVGVVFQPYLYIGSGDSSTSAYAAYADAQHIVGFKGLTSIYARFATFADARQHSASFRQALTRNSAYKIVFHLLDDPQENAFIVGVRRTSNVLMIVGVVAMIVASFLVTNVISTVMAEQRRQIGALKAVGATRLDLFIIYLGTALAYGLIGTIPALALGIPLGQAAARATAPLANIVLDDVRPSLRAIGLGVLMGLMVPVLAAFIPIYTGTKITVLEAMSDWGIESRYGKGFFPWLVRLLPLPMPLEQALNNVLHRRGRLALTILSLTLAAAAFMGMFAVFETLTGVIRDIQSSLHYPVSVNPADLQMASIVQTLITSEAEQIRSIRPGVAIELEVIDPATTSDATEPFDTLQAPQKIFVTGVDTLTDLQYLPLEIGVGWRENPNTAGIVITPAMARRFGKNVGDTLELVSPENTALFKIIGIAPFPVQTAFMEWQQLAAFVGVIPEAPTPNDYWEEVKIKREGQESLDTWAIGIDEQFGKFLTPAFDPAQPGIIISRALATSGGYEIGQSLELLPPPDSQFFELVEPLLTPRSYPIIAIADVNPGQLALVGRAVPPALLKDDPAVIAMYWADLATLVGLDYKALTPQMFYIDLANPVADTATANATSPPVAVHTNQIGFADRIAQTILSMGLVMSFASLLMALVGGIGLLTIMSISVFERQREIGVMRSVGATTAAILTQFLIEGVVVGLIAWLLGIPLSYGLSHLLINAVPFREVIAFDYSLRSPLVGCAGMLLMTLLATLSPSIAAARKTVSAILRYQ